MGETRTQNHASSNQSASVQNAMNVINRAIQDSHNEVREVLERDYEQLRNSLASAKPELKAALKEIGQASIENLQKAKQVVERKTRETADFVDESVHEKPWVFIGVAAALFAIVGFLFGRKSK